MVRKRRSPISPTLYDLVSVCSPVIKEGRWSIPRDDHAAVLSTKRSVDTTDDDGDIIPATFGSSTIDTLDTSENADDEDLDRR